MAEDKGTAKDGGETSGVSFTTFFSFSNLCSLLQAILRACARFLGLPCPTSPEPKDQDSSQPQEGEGNSSTEAESAVVTGESKPPKKKGVSDGGKGGGQHN